MRMTRPRSTRTPTSPTPPDTSDAGSVKDGAKGEPASSGSGGEELRDIIRNTIATEMGVEVDEILAAPDLANLGMDSLMSLSILGTIREKTGLNIPSDLFVSNPSLKDVERALGINAAPKRPAAAPKQAKAPAPQPKHPRIGLEEPAPPKPPRPTNIIDSYPHRKASSVLLSGSHRTATKHLFMIPDGSGSATSYTEIADVGGEWAVWGLFSPFMKTPEEYHCGVYGMATKFIDEMRPPAAGRPLLARWLVRRWRHCLRDREPADQGRRQGRSPDHHRRSLPRHYRAAPSGLHAWFASIGLLGDGDDKKIPSWLLPHFAGLGHGS